MSNIPFIQLFIHHRPLRRLVGRKAAMWLFAGAIAGCVAAIVEIVISVQIVQLLQLIGAAGGGLPLPGGGEVTSFWSLSLVFISLGVLRGAAYFFISQSGTVAQETIMVRLRVLASFETFQRKDGFLSLSRLYTLTADVFPRATVFCLAAATFVPGMIQLVIIMGILMYKSWILTIAGVLGVGLIGLVVHLANVRVRAIAGQFPALYEVITSRMTRMAKNWFFLRAVRKMTDEYSSLVGASIAYASSVVRAYQLGNAAAVLPQSLGMIVVLGVIGLQAEFRLLEALVFVSFLYLFIRFIQVLGHSASTYSALNANFRHFSMAMDYVAGIPASAFQSALLSIQEETAKASVVGVRRSHNLKEEDWGGDTPAPSISFQNVTFRYRDELSPVISNFCLSVPATGRLALMGASGSGKSTILALCLGVLKPQSGVITVGGEDPERYFSRFSHRLGYVGAEPFLVEGSIRENLCYGLDRLCSDDELLASLSDAGLGEWAAEMVKPLEYGLSEAGEGLSTGQKQRLMLARALLRRPLLLVLDEMSANLDRVSEQEIKRFIGGLRGCTLLTVSHRLEFVEGTHVISKL